ncbi:MAG TPA: hydrolase, partial [Solirubrobacterales bacterium]|nr:hydrolase [Solirubrobacterales bacterium]
MEEPRLILATEPPPSPARTRPPQRPPLRIAAVQQRWHPDPAEHEEALAAGVRIAAGAGARLVCL